MLRAALKPKYPLVLLFAGDAASEGPDDELLGWLFELLRGDVPFASLFGARTAHFAKLRRTLVRSFPNEDFSGERLRDFVIARARVCLRVVVCCCAHGRGDRAWRTRPGLEPQLLDADASAIPGLSHARR